jgi:hypothetical protein
VEPAAQQPVGPCDRGCAVLVAYDKQSPDIAQGVDKAQDDPLNQGAYWNALYTGSRLFGFGPSVIKEGDLFIDKGSYLWGIQSGWGGPFYINESNRHQTVESQSKAHENMQRGKSATLLQNFLRH